MEQLLEPLERAASELPPSQHHADIEREGIYQLATSTDLELNQFLSEIREIAEHVDSSGAHLARVIGDENAITASDHDAGRPKDPIGQVTRILNAHMHSLNRIHQNTRESSILTVRMFAFEFICI
ncbi:unnamed protein product [Protopolystoma xenopodis]|uniref:Uncharacterized protein n=1 Tax=Protopolystoma xenopodis TaxID=117903 RepID=A0A3S5AQK0_9PLAT|nr:unnamed protein product [Protopolystoma xenopodis]